MGRTDPRGWDVWIATLRRLALEGSMWTIGVNPCVHIEQIPIDFPDRARVWRVEQDDEWVEPGNSAIVNPRGELVAGPVAHEEKILLAEIDVNQVHARRQKFDSVGHYNRPDVFRLSIDASERRAVDALNWSDKNGRELENRLANYIPEAALGARCVSRHERVTARPASA